MKTTETFTDQLLGALKPVLARLQVLADHDPALRAELRQLGESILAFAAEPPAITQASEPSLVMPTAPLAIARPEDDSPLISATETTSVQSVTADHGAKPPLVDAPPRLTFTAVPVPTPQTPRPLPPPKPYGATKRSLPWLNQPAVQVYSTDDLQPSRAATTLDFAALVQNCTLKKEAARWAAERQQRLAQGYKGEPELEAQRLKLIENAQLLTDCYLWMCQREAPTGLDPLDYMNLAGCFEATAQILPLLEAIVTNEEDDEPFLEPALTLAAEAQAALRNAITAVNGTVDSDQMKLFQWLKAMTYQHQIRIREYMSKENSAQPAAWTTLRERIQELNTKIQEYKQLTKQRQKLFGKVRHRCRVIETALGEERLEDWQRLVEAVTSLLDSGLPPSNIELRDYLLPILDQLPAVLELPKNFQLVLREIDRFLATRAPLNEEFEASAPIEEVQRVRELLRGQTVVLIGGERRQAAATALTTAFALQELIWIEGHDQTYTDFEPQVARPEVAVVLLAIRWSRHGFGEVKEFCLRYGKPLVRLLGGYNPNQVAYTILSQIGQRLLPPEQVP